MFASTYFEKQFQFLCYFNFNTWILSEDGCSWHITHSDIIGCPERSKCSPVERWMPWIDPVLVFCNRFEKFSGTAALLHSFVDRNKDVFSLPFRFHVLTFDQGERLSIHQPTFLLLSIILLKWPLIFTYSFVSLEVRCSSTSQFHCSFLFGIVQWLKEIRPYKDKKGNHK